MLFLQPPLTMKSLMTWIKQHDETLNPKAVFQFLQGGDQGLSSKPNHSMRPLTSDNKTHTSTRRSHAHRYDLMRDSPTFLETPDTGDRNSIALFVSDETLDITAARTFQSMLTTKNSISEIKLTNLKFVDDKTSKAFGTALIRGLTNAPQLVRLTLRNCQISDETVTALAEHGLQFPCSHLSYLDLSDNPAISDKGVFALMHGIVKQQQRQHDDKGQKLESLSLNNIRLTQNTFHQMLSSRFLSNSKLTHLSLHSNNVLLPPQVWQDLAYALQDNFCLQSLAIGTFSMSAVSSFDGDDSAALSLWCAPAVTVEALQHIEYYLSRNRAVKDWLHQPIQPNLAVKYTKCLEKRDQRCRPKNNFLKAFSETPSSVDSESFALSLLFDWVRQNPQTIVTDTADIMCA